MEKPNASLIPSQTSRHSQVVDVSDSREIQERLITLNRVLRLRFRDYSSDAKELVSLNSILDSKTLDDVITEACSTKTFDDFRQSVERICNKYEALTESLPETPELVLANVFNNHVATVLGKPGEITTQFLRMSVRNISPELAEQLDFERAKSEPTVFVFGNNVSRICDLIFTIPYKDGREGVFPIIVLMEHKSAPDRNVVQQMLTSLVATLDFAKRYPERFKTPDGKIVWPFVVLFYTGARQWNEVQNLSDLFTTTLKELDRDWIFNLRFLLISLVHKKIAVVPTIEGKGKKTPETFDKALMNADWLAFFFDLLCKAELLANNPNATREEWMNDAQESLRLFKKAGGESEEYAGVILDDAFCFITTMCAKKNFALPTHDELTEMMQKEGMEKMIRRTWLLSDEEREAAERKGRSDGERKGKRKGELKGRREALVQMIYFRFPQVSPAFVKKASKILSLSSMKEATFIIMTSDSLEGFKKRVNALTPVGC